VHLGGKNIKKIKLHDLAQIEFKQFLCLDIKQSYKEFNKIIVLVEFICHSRGKILIASGGRSVVNNNLSQMLLCNHPYLIPGGNFNGAGIVVNFARPFYGIPSLAFVANSDRSWYITLECLSFCIPTISLVDFHMKHPFIKDFNL
jgi:hypothetical protein